MWPFTRTAKPDPLVALSDGIDRALTLRKAAREAGFVLHRKAGR